MCCGCDNCHRYSHINRKYDRNRYCDVEEHHCYCYCYCYYHYHPSKPDEPSSDTDSLSSLESFCWTSDEKSSSSSSARKVEPSVMTKTYSPVFSVRYYNHLNERTLEHDPHVTRRLRSAYSKCGIEQVESSINCAILTATIVEAFYRDINTQGWLFAVQIPEKTKVKKSITTITDSPVRVKDMTTDELRMYKKHGTVVRPVATKQPWWAPALKEKYLPNTRTIFATPDGSLMSVTVFPKGFSLRCHTTALSGAGANT